MRNFRGSLLILVLIAMLTTILVSCGSHSGGESQPLPPQTGDTSLFPHNELLASAADLANLTASQTILLDARRTAAEYDDGHIPGAIFAPPSLFEKDGIILPDDQLATILGNMGITRTSKIIIYDNTTASKGAAGRLFWILEHLGCSDVTILNGGYDQWIAQENPWDQIVVALPPSEFTPEINLTVIVEQKAAIAAHFLPAPDAGFVLVDVRTETEYQSGHLPGAINFPYSKCFNPEDKTVLNFYDLKLLLTSYGITESNQIIAYSTKGYRSGFFYYLCRLMGYSNVANYLNAIEDWKAENPTAYGFVTGPAPY